jgi:hypothetical protein
MARVALKMDRRLRCWAVTSRTIFVLAGREPNGRSTKMVRDAPSHCQSGSNRPAKAGPAAHFERNDVTIVCETVRYQAS